MKISPVNELPSFPLPEPYKSGPTAVKPPALHVEPATPEAILDNTDAMDEESIYDNYTDAARRIVFYGRREAHMAGAQAIAPEHLLIVMLREPCNLAGCCSRDRASQILQALSQHFPKLAAPEEFEVDDLLPDAATEQVLASAADEARLLGDTAVDDGHLLLGLLRSPGSAAARLLNSHGIHLAQCREAVRKRRSMPDNC